MRFFLVFLLASQLLSAKERQVLLGEQFTFSIPTEKRVEEGEADLRIGRMLHAASYLDWPFQVVGKERKANEVVVQLKALRPGKFLLLDGWVEVVRERPRTILPSFLPVGRDEEGFRRIALFALLAFASAGMGGLGFRLGRFWDRRRSTESWVRVRRKRIAALHSPEERFLALVQLFCSAMEREGKELPDRANEVLYRAELVAYAEQASTEEDFRGINTLLESI